MTTGGLDYFSGAESNFNFPGGNTGGKVSAVYDSLVFKVFFCKCMFCVSIPKRFSHVLSIPRGSMDTLRCSVVVKFVEITLKFKKFGTVRKISIGRHSVFSILQQSFGQDDNRSNQSINQGFL